MNLTNEGYHQFERIPQMGILSKNTAQVGWERNETFSLDLLSMDATQAILLSTFDKIGFSNKSSSKRSTSRER